jgi:16S rRNA (cytidine1402-2'-O)-methyltransferase
MQTATIYLIPIALHKDESALQAIPFYIVEAVKKCSVLYVENERTARRFLKKIWKEINIDAYEWHTIHKAGRASVTKFSKRLISTKNDRDNE